jgi:excisionase family DNA binding protein
MPSYFFSTGKAARELGVPQSTIRALCSGGAIAAQTTPGGQWRIPQEEIDRLKHDGIPVMPTPMPADSSIARAPRSSAVALLADPSEATITAADEVARLESEVAAVGLKRQLEEGRDWFRERENRAAEEQVRLDEEEWERERKASEEQQRRSWHDKWLQYGLDRKPWDAPQDSLLEIQGEVEKALSKLHPTHPDQITRRLIDAAVERALATWTKRKETERAVQTGCTRLPWAMVWSTDGAIRKREAERIAWEAVRKLGEEASYSAMENAIDRALQPMITEFEHQQKLDLFANTATLSLRGATREELADAKEAVLEALGTLPAGATERQIQQAGERALISIRTTLSGRQDQAMRAEVLRSAKFRIGYSSVPLRSEAKAMEIIQRTLDGLPQGTLERDVQAAVNGVIARFAESQRRKEQSEQQRRALIDRGLQEISPYLTELAEEWQFDESLYGLALRLRDPIRASLDGELDGTESPEDVIRIVRQLVREEVDIY